MINELSVQATFTASLPLLVLVLADVAAAGILDLDHFRAGVERKDRHPLLGLSAAKQAAPRGEPVRLANAANVVAPRLASKGPYR